MSLLGIPCVLKADFCGLGVVQVGKLLVFESGAVKLQMGDVLLDVAAGTPCQFRQEVASINAREGHFVFLGDVAQRVVCSPNVEQLIRSASCCIGNCFVCNHTQFVLQSSCILHLVCLHCVSQLHNQSQITISLWVLKEAAVPFAAAASQRAALEA